MTSGKLQTLDRGITALQMVARTEGGLKIAELADELGLNRAIVYRLVATLADHGMVQRLADGRIVLGSGAILLAAHAERNLRALARPLVESLAEHSGATAFLSMAQGSDCVAILTAEPRDAFLNIHYRVGTRHPIDRGAPGLAILAGRPERPGDSEAVKAARRDGYCVTRGELQKGAVGVASPIRMSSSGLTGIELSIGVVALDNLDLERARDAVIDAAERFSSQLDLSPASGSPSARTRTPRRAPPG